MDDIIKKFLSKFVSAKIRTIKPDASTLKELDSSGEFVPYYKFDNDNHYRTSRLSHTELQDVFKSYVNFDVFKTKIDTLTKIYEDSVYICAQLEPIRRLGIHITLDITGGAVRDFITGQTIKDLDVMISFNNTSLTQEGVSDYTRAIGRQHLAAAGFTPEQLQIVDWKYGAETSQTAKCKLIQMCFLGSSRNMFVPDPQKDYDILERVEGVIKIKDKTHYPIDLIVTDMVKPQFVNYFDFDICKASFCIVNNHYKKEAPKSPMELLTRFVAEQEFFEDLHFKEITLQTYARTKARISYSLEHHLPRIQSKYPDYKVIVKPGNAPLEQFAKSLLEKKSIEKEIGLVSENKKQFKL